MRGGGIDTLSLIPPGVLFLRYFTLTPSSFPVHSFFSLSICYEGQRLAGTRHQSSKIQVCSLTKSNCLLVLSARYSGLSDITSGLPVISFLFLFFFS